MKEKCLFIIFLIFTQCTYNPVVDTSGRSGTFNKSTAENLTNDLIICRELADNYSNNFIEGYKVAHNWWLRPQTLWLMPKLEYKKKKIIKKCLINRGHSVID